jgi:hypothetical protein
VRVSLEWWGVGSRDTLRPDVVAHLDAVADAGRDAHWQRLLELLETTRLDGTGWYLNGCRVGGLARYAPLHQVAWGGAPAAVAAALVDLGAWRTLRCAVGQTPLAVAQSRGHRHLDEVLTAQPVRDIAEDTLAQLEYVLHALIASRALRLLRESCVALPQLGPLTEIDKPVMWFPVPGMHGGFRIELTAAEQDYELDVTSWCRVMEGSHERHRVRPNGFELLETSRG